MDLKKYTLILLNLIVFSNGSFIFNHVKCSEFDKAFATIPICELKVIRNDVVALDLLVKLHQVPVNNVTVQVQLLKKANGYRPFLYNIKTDFCQYMSNRKNFPFLNILSTALTKYSNINHTCPFDHDLIVRRMILKDEIFGKIPLPQGDYLYNFRVGAYNDWKALVQAFVSVKE